MSTETLIPLQKWATQHYGENAPTIGTLRRWCRDMRIFPAPRKHGRSYFVEESARYVGDFSNPGFLEAIRGTTQA